MEKMPQTLINVRVNDKHAVEDSAEVAAAVASAEEALGEDGRVLCARVAPSRWCA